MVKLEFKINNYYLASYTIQYNRYSDLIPSVANKYQKDIVNFQNLAFSTSRDFCRLIEGRYALKDYLFLDSKPHVNLKEQITKYLDTLILSDEFNVLLSQTQGSVLLCKKEWASNLVKTSKYINDLGIDLGGNYSVYMVHPAFIAGQYKLNNVIVWSHQTIWDNYNTVYLWHELLHSFFDFSEVSHALIELITDEQMRVLLNGGTYPPFVGHKNLIPLKSKILPAWESYLSSSNKNILKFHKSLCKNLA